MPQDQDQPGDEPLSAAGAGDRPSTDAAAEHEPAVDAGATHDEAVRWPVALSPDDARELLVERAKVSRRRRSAYRDADLVTSDASVATFTLRMLTQFRAVKATRRRCDGCAGRGQRPCEPCAGRGDAGCAGCAGTGRQICTTCEGEGRLISGEAPVASSTTGKRTASYGQLPPGARRAGYEHYSSAGDAVPAGLPDEVAQIVAPLLRADDREVGRRLDVDVVPVTKVDVWNGDDNSTAWVVGTDQQVIDSRARVTRRRTLVGATLAGVALAATALAASGLLRPTAPDTVASATTGAATGAEPSEASSDASQPPDVDAVADANSSALQRWRDLGILDGSDADLVDRAGSPVLTLLEAWEQDAEQVPGGAVTDEALAQAHALGTLDADAVDLLGCAFWDDLPEGFTPVTATFTCVFEWNGSSLEIYLDGGASAGYSVGAVASELQEPGAGPAAAPDEPAATPEVEVVRLDGDTPIGLRGIGPIAVGMTVAQAERAAGQRIIAENFDVYSGTCFYAHVEGLEEEFFLLVESPSIDGVSDPRDGIITRVSATQGMASPAQTLSGVGVGDPEHEVYDTYPDQIVQEPHFYIDGGSYLTFVPRSSADQDFRVKFFTDGQVVQEIHAGYAGPTGYVEGCS